MQDGIRVSIIVATDTGGVIGNSKTRSGLPWTRHKADTDHFVEKTRGRPIVIGSTSYLLVPPQFRPFRGRPTVIISRSKDLSGEKNPLGESPRMARSVKQAIDIAIALAKETGVDEIFIAGGEQIYREALGYGWVDRIYLTKIMGAFQGDTYFPEMDSLPERWKPTTRRSVSANTENPHDMLFLVLDKKPR